MISMQASKLINSPTFATPLSSTVWKRESFIHVRNSTSNIKIKDVSILRIWLKLTWFESKALQGLKRQYLLSQSQSSAPEKISNDVKIWWYLGRVHNFNLYLHEEHLLQIKNLKFERNTKQKASCYIKIKNKKNNVFYGESPFKFKSKICKRNIYILVHGEGPKPHYFH